MVSEVSRDLLLVEVPRKLPTDRTEDTKSPGKKGKALKKSELVSML